MEKKYCVQWVLVCFVCMTLHLEKEYCGEEGGSDVAYSKPTRKGGSGIYAAPVK